MALINCPECQKQVSELAQTCPHCGFRLRNNDNSQKPKKVNGCLAILIIAAVLISAIFLIGLFNNDSTDNVNTPNKFLAYEYAEQFVKKGLKSPSTAKFPSYSEKEGQITDLGGGEYRINSWVDSQNSFGAEIRTSFSCKIKFDGENVQCEQLLFR